MTDPSVAWLVGDAEQLPIDDASMDAFTIAFGIRNCTHIDRVIKVPPPCAHLHPLSCTMHPLHLTNVGVMIVCHHRKRTAC